MQADKRVGQPVLVFDQVGVPSDAGEADVSLSFALAGGEVVWISLDSDSDSLPLVELALGLFDLERGSVQFEGRDWMSMNAFEQAAARGRCGAVFNQPAWISSMPVPENIALRLEHATSLSSAAIHDDAAAKAQVAGLTAIDTRRPDFVPARELRVLEWVRAFVGRPALVVLVCPEAGAPAGMLPGLAALVRQATEQGTAVLWVSRGRAGDLLDDDVPRREFSLRDGVLMVTPQEGKHEQTV